MSDEYTPPKTSASYSVSGSMGAGGYGASSVSVGASQMGGVPQEAPASAPQGPAVRDVTTAEFMAEVIEASRHAPVIVDFWAPWCGPCKQLGPVIEKVVTEAVSKGQGVTLCKMDVEKYPEVSQQMGIQSIPAVVAFVDGKPADAFMGAKPESEIRAFVDKVAAPAPEQVNMALALEEAEQVFRDGSYAEAAEMFSQILQQEPGNLDAFAGLGECYVAIGAADMAQKLIDNIPEEHRTSAPLEKLQKTIDLAVAAESLGDLDTLATAVKANPNDHQARFDYALALNGRGQREEATNQLVAIVRADRKWNDDGARTQLLEFFESWGNMDPSTLAGRRALSSVLFS